MKTKKFNLLIALLAFTFLETYDIAYSQTLEEGKADNTTPTEFSVIVLDRAVTKSMSILEALGTKNTPADFSEPTALLFITKQNKLVLSKKGPSQMEPNEKLLRLAKLLNLVVVRNEKMKAHGAVVYLAEPEEEFTKNLLDAYLKIPITKYVAKPDQKTRQIESDLKTYENTAGYQLKLASDLPSIDHPRVAGHPQVIVALVDGKLNIRVIDNEGAIVIEKDETQLVSSLKLSDLKKRLASSSFPIDGLQKKIEQEIIETVLASAGGILRAYPATVVIWKNRKITEIISLSAEDIEKGSKEKELVEKYLELFKSAKSIPE